MATGESRPTCLMVCDAVVMGLADESIAVDNCRNWSGSFRVGNMVILSSYILTRPECHPVIYVWPAIMYRFLATIYNGSWHSDYQQMDGDTNAIEPIYSVFLGFYN